jgi:hypothetical protein
MFSDSGKDFVRVLQESAFEKEQGHVIVEPLDENNILVPEHEARFAPFDLLDETATPGDLLQGRGFLGVLVPWVLHWGMARPPAGSVYHWCSHRHLAA